MLNWHPLATIWHPLEGPGMYISIRFLLLDISWLAANHLGFLRRIGWMSRINSWARQILLSIYPPWNQHVRSKNGWLQDNPASYWGQRPIFRGELLVSGRVYLLSNVFPQVERAFPQVERTQSGTFRQKWKEIPWNSLVCSPVCEGGLGCVPNLCYVETYLS